MPWHPGPRHVAGRINATQCWVNGGRRNGGERRKGLLIQNTSGMRDVNGDW